MSFRNKTFLIACLILVLSFYGCQKAQLLGEYYLDALYYENPYHGYEKLVFTTSDKVEIQLFGEGRYSTIHKAYVSVNSNDFYLWESDIASFITEDGYYRVSVYMRASKYDYENRLSLGWRDYMSDTAGYIGAGSGNKLPLDPNNLLPQNEFLDSLVIRNNVYYNVFVDSTRTYRENLQPIDSSFIFPTIVYYNNSNGFLKFDFNDGSAWELKDVR